MNRARLVARRFGRACSSCPMTHDTCPTQNDRARWFAGELFGGGVGLGVGVCGRGELPDAARQALRAGLLRIWVEW